MSVLGSCLDYYNQEINRLVEEGYVCRLRQQLGNSKQIPTKQTLPENLSRLIDKISALAKISFIYLSAMTTVIITSICILPISALAHRIHTLGLCSKQRAETTYRWPQIALHILSLQRTIADLEHGKAFISSTYALEKDAYQKFLTSEAFEKVANHGPHGENLCLLRKGAGMYDQLQEYEEEKFDETAFKYAERVIKHPLNRFNPILDDLMRLAKYFEEGIGTEKKPARALYYYKMAADRHQNQRACAKTASISRELGNEENYRKYTEKANIVSLTKKAEQGDMQAKFDLIGIKQQEDPQEAKILGNEVLLLLAKKGRENEHAMLYLIQNDLIHPDRKLLMELNHTGILLAVAERGNEDLARALIGIGVDFTKDDSHVLRIMPQLRRWLNWVKNKRQEPEDPSRYSLPRYLHLTLASLNPRHFCRPTVQRKSGGVAKQIDMETPVCRWLNKMEDRLPESFLVDEDRTVTKEDMLIELKKKMREFDQFSPYEYPSTSFGYQTAQKLQNTFRHLISTLIIEESRLNASDDEIEKKIFEKKLVRIFIYDLGIAFFNCNSRLIALEKNLNDELLMQEPMTISEKILKALQMKRSHLFEKVVDHHLPNNIHQANTLSYLYQCQKFSTFGLGEKIYDPNVEQEGQYAKYVMWRKSECEKREIIGGVYLDMQKQLTVDLYLKWFFQILKEGTMIKWEELFTWFEDHYPQLKRDQLLTSDGDQWRDTALAFVLERLGIIHYP